MDRRWAFTLRPLRWSNQRTCIRRQRRGDPLNGALSAKKVAHPHPRGKPGGTNLSRVSGVQQGHRGGNAQRSLALLNPA